MKLNLLSARGTIARPAGRMTDGAGVKLTGKSSRRPTFKQPTTGAGSTRDCSLLPPLPERAAKVRYGAKQTSLKVTDTLPIPALSVEAASSQRAELPATPRYFGSLADNILERYMRDAGEVDLLTPAQEVELAARIKRGDMAAREHMIRANLRFVIKIARDYEHLGMPLLDLINEGNIGLMKAVERFDPSKGGKLSTYAVLWIKQQIRRALASQGKTIRLPVHVADRIYQLSKAEARLRNELGRDATDEELAHELGIKHAKIAKLRRAALRPASLDMPLGDNDSSTIAEVVADENAATPFEQLQVSTETDLIRKLVETLPEREARIIRFRFGLDGGNERTLEDVGRKFKLTRERIRQLQNIALQKLRRMLEEPDACPLAA